MSLLTRTYTALPQNPEWPSLCLKLRLMWVDERLQHWGPQLLQYTRLRSLHIQGNASLFDNKDFRIPLEVSRLQALRSLVLLNLPIDFPEWIIALPNLRYLMLRGTCITKIPDWISRLNKLHTLHIENCGLYSLPLTMRRMDNLRELGLRDTCFWDFSPEQFPQKLKYLSFAGTGYYRRSDLENLQRALSGTKVAPYWPPGYDRALFSMIPPFAEPAP